MNTQRVMIVLWLFHFAHTTQSFGGEDDMSEIPVSGQARPELAALDKWAVDFMREHSVPGGSLAVVKEGKLVYARGFGYADREKKTPVEPGSLFRIASVSKPITAVAVLQLVERGKLRLDDKIALVLKMEPHLEEGAKLDPRWNDVTIEHCLAHTGGWNRGKSYDPMFQAERMAKSLGIELPIEPGHVIRYMLGQPLDSDPGSEYAYSNFGYCLLGRAIEKVSGLPYEKYVQDEVFAPLGIKTPRIGMSLANEQLPGEVRYYTAKNSEALAVTGPAAGKEKVPVGYGTWRQETLDAHGGWIASTIDLARFAAAFDEPVDGSSKRAALLKPDLVSEMFKPRTTIAAGKDGKPALSYGYGWMVSADDEGRITARHGGALPCTAAMLMQLPGRISVAALFNLGQSPDGVFISRGLDAPLGKVVLGIEKWPEP
jgi:N-acyl-D-amino-acid deacylase